MKMDKVCVVGAIYLKKAFDIFNHQILISKLARQGSILITGLPCSACEKNELQLVCSRCGNNVKMGFCLTPFIIAL